MGIWNDVSLTGAISDLRFIKDQTPRERVLPGLLAIICPAIIFYGFYIDAKTNMEPPPGSDIIYAESWPLGRSEEEILRDRWEIQCLKNKHSENMRLSYKALGRASGIDVEQIERDSAKARAERAELERQSREYRGVGDVSC